MKKIVLIGPVYPYKGGISHYTSLMYRALSKKYDVSMVSYKLQYPKFLFKKEQKDFTNNFFEIPETKYWINTANPINWFISAYSIKKLKPDLIIFQWWHPYFMPCYKIMTCLLKNIKILFVCHNVFPHEPFFLNRFLVRTALKKIDYYLVQSKQDENDLLSIKPNAFYQRTVHPTYNIFKITNINKSDSRKLLKLSNDQPVLLFFGFIREYKGLKHLILAMPNIISKHPDVKLLIVGDFSGDKEAYLQIIKEQHVEKYIEIYDGYIPDKDVEKFFSACDLVILPYETATQSGIVQIAYGFEKPVIVSNVGGLPEVVEDGKTGYIIPPKDPDKISDAICKFFSEDQKVNFRENIIKESYRYSWDRITTIVEDLYRYGSNK
ncbi:glycosyltransferase family 4 protein [Hungatella effluvii]|uniref:glycosyltransferase family 4 protein n=1 Tax=Hungatella effluvii TaxID=1096246 RepID=UPI0022E1F8CA|nr:glycosyltransferase family 4 protein [Hungatella effluvii]